MKYKAFADVAEREKLPNVARLFRAASYAEQMHATNHLRALGGIGKTSENLAAAFAGETFEINEMYPAYMAVAELQGEKKRPRQHARRLGGREDPCRALRRGPGSRRRGHGRLATRRSSSARPAAITVEGEAPEKCPVCGAVRTKFKQF